MCDPAVTLNSQQMRALLRAFVEASASVKEAAERLGVTGRYLHQVLMMEIGVSDNMARRLGYHRVSRYINIMQEEKIR